MNLLLRLREIIQNHTLITNNMKNNIIKTTIEMTKTDKIDNITKFIMMTILIKIIIITTTIIIINNTLIEITMTEIIIITIKIIIII